MTIPKIGNEDIGYTVRAFIKELPGFAQKGGLSKFFAQPVHDNVVQTLTREAMEALAKPVAASEEQPPFAPLPDKRNEPPFPLISTESETDERTRNSGARPNFASVYLAAEGETSSGNPESIEEGRRGSSSFTVNETDEIYYPASHGQNG